MKHISANDTKSALLEIGLISMKSIFFALMMGVCILFITSLLSSANAASLRELAVVNDDVIRVNDLFDGVKRNADAVVGHAPTLGKEITVNSRSLNRIANLYNIAWSPKSGNESITIRRDAHVIDTSVIEQNLRESLAEKGLDGSYTITLTTPNATLMVPADMPATVAVTDLDYTPGRETFNAKIVAPSLENPLKTLEISGQIARTVSLPSLNRTIRKGELISASDIQFLDMPERLILRDHILDADQLIGMTPSRVIPSGRPVKSSDVTAPQMVSRGDDITIQYNVGGMVLTAKGRAMDNGAKGQFIRITNLSSAKQLQGEVTDMRVVTVR